ncbi:MAG: glutamate--tRNA ligase [Candidatus Tectomicrobia bacterium]|nr:glutamate--tRNA ligase [Candidatus Tectomicrobia bacterium]
MSTEVRVRFAPSPTGFLHIGGVRTALFNWFFARRHGGKFILRIEDTDRERSTDESIQQILDALRWLGIDWDEGPHRQTERQAIYTEYAQRLLAEGKAYRCYCAPEELEEMRERARAEGRTPRYDGRCRSRTDEPGLPFALRFKAPQEGTTVIHDLLRGDVSFDNAQLDDMIILRSDGTPTYNFAVVVDDVDMRVSHVIRGDDHLANTPRQAMIYAGLGWELPQFAHVSLILGPDRKRLSKRHGATSVQEYQREGFLPEATINYLVRLGWSHGDQEIFTRQEIIGLFSLEPIGTSAAIFDVDKLLWVNSQHMNRMEPPEIIPRLAPFLAEEGVEVPEDPAGRRFLERVIRSLRERSRTLKELARSARYFYRSDFDYDGKAAEKFLTPESGERLKKLRSRLAGLRDFGEESIHQVFERIVEEDGVKLVAVAQPARVAVTGGTVSPPITEVLSILGREETLSRLDRAIARIEKGAVPG